MNFDGEEVEEDERMAGEWREGRRWGERGGPEEEDGVWPRSRV